MSGPVSGPGAGAGAGALGDVIAMRRQIVESSEALRALNRTGAAETAPSSSPAAGAGFADMLKGAVDAVNSAQAQSAAMTEAYERGEVTDIAKVMLARQESGLAFEATLQVRNKLLSAYQDIMRMGV